MDVSSGHGDIILDYTTLPSYPYSGTFAEGSVIMLEAKPAFGYEFAGWEGHVYDMKSVAYVEMDCNKMVYARFRLNRLLISGVAGGLGALVTSVTIAFIQRKIIKRRKRSSKR